MADTSESPETASRGSGIHDRNRRLRHSYLELESLANEADSQGDHATASRARARMKTIADRFVSLNANLVGPVARKFRTTDSRTSWEDYDAAGMYGLWEAFMKWDPDRTTRNRTSGRTTHVTFGTFSRPYIEGRVNREVAKTEHHEVSYHDFTERTKLRAVEAELSRDGLRAPSNEEIAAAASEKLGRNVTVAQVDRIRRARPASLDKKVGSDAGSSTLGEMVADTVVDDEVTVDVDHVASLRDVIDELDGLSLFLLVRRDSLDGAESQTINQIAAITGLGREVLRRRYNTAREILQQAAVTAASQVTEDAAVTQYADTDRLPVTTG